MSKSNCSARKFLFCLLVMLAGILMPADLKAQVAYATIEDNVMTFYYGTQANMDARDGAMDVTEKFNGGWFWPDGVEEGDIVKVVFDASFASFRPTNLSSLFQHFSSLETIEGIAYLNTEAVTDMSFMFSSCKKLQSLDVTKFNTSKVTKFNSMFSSCESLQSLDVGGFDTRNANDMDGMFSSCSGLTSLDVTKFVTSNVEIMADMFKDCENLTSLNIKNFDTSNVSSMQGMFSGCANLKTLDLSKFNTSKVKMFNSMFSDCVNLESLDLRNFDTSNGTNMNGMFAGCKSLRKLDISTFVTEGVIAMNNMFSDCAGLKNLDLRHFNTSTVGNMKEMFKGCTALESVDVSKFNTSNVKFMYSMFEGCTRLRSVDVSGFNTVNVDQINAMFEGCASLRTLNLSSFKCELAYSMRDCTNLLSVVLGPGIKKLDRDTFAGCDNLLVINAMMANPLETDDRAFSKDHFSRVRLNVPKGSIAAYRNTADWKKFANIQEVEYSSEVTQLEPLRDENSITYAYAGWSSDQNVDGKIINNIFYNIGGSKGGYDAASGTVRISSATKASVLESADFNSVDFRQAFSGIVAMVENEGLLSITAEGDGSTEMTVQVGSRDPKTFTVGAKKTFDIDCNETWATYVYIYCPTLSAPINISSISWKSGKVSDGIDTVSASSMHHVDSRIYTLDGRYVGSSLQDLPRGVYVVGGKKVVK